MHTGDENESSLSHDLTGFLELSFDAVVVFDAREHITYWNPAAEQMFGWTAQQALGKTSAKLFWQVKTPEEKKDHRQRQLRLKRGETLRGEQTVFRRDGSSLCVQYVLRASFEADGTLAGYMGIYRGIPVQAQDATVHKQEEESLRDRTEEIEALLKVSPVAIFVAHDPECTHITGNPAGYRLVELPENSGVNISKSAPAPERPTYRTFRNGVEVPAQDLPMQKAASLGVEVSEEDLELRFEDGSRKFLYAFAKPLFDAQGRSRGAVAAMLDITERKRSEQLIKESAEKFRNIFDQSPIGIGVYDADGKLINLNRAAMQMFGIPSPDKIMGLSLFSSPTVHAEVRMKLHNQEQVREEIIYDFDEIMRLGFYETTKSGISYFDRIITPLYSAFTDEPFGYLSQVLDITERKRAEQQLEQSNQWLYQILESIQDDFYVIDRTWKFVFTSKSFTSKVGKEPKDFIGNNIWEMFPKHVGTIFEENLRAAMEEREIRRFEIPGKYTDAWYRINVFPSEEGITVLGTDITERKRLEAETELMARFPRENPNPILRVSQEGVVLFGNQVSQKLLEDWNCSIGMLLPDSWRKEVTGQFHLGVPGEILLERNGRIISLHIVPIVEGQYLNIYGRDITEHKRSEEALRESEERLRRMIETSLVAIGFGDSTGKIFGANASFYRLTGYSREEIEARQLGWNHLTAPEYAELDQQMMATLAATGSAGPYEKEYIRKDGSRVPLLLTISKLPGLPGHDEHIAFIMDISESKHREEQLRELSQRLTYHVDNSPLAVIEWGSDMRLIRWSGAAERIFGWKAEEVFGKRMEDLRWIYEEDTSQVSDVSVDLQTGTDPQRFSANRNYRKDGSIAYCEWYNSSLLDESGKLRSILSLVMDVTERKRAEETLHDHQKQLQLLNETLEQKVQDKTEEVRHLASDLVQAVQHERHRISHILHDDLQQRIYAIQMQLTFLHDEFQKENETARREVSEIEKQLTEILQVTRHLSIDLSPPILRDEGLSHAIHWLAAQMRQRYGLDIEIRANGDFTIVNEALHVLLFNCVRELLFNVVKHAQASQAVVTLQWADDDLQVEVRDNGRGFPGDMSKQQESEEIRVEALRSGFGLSTIRYQLSLFGGHLEIHSEPGAGARIRLIVPITVEASEA